MILCVDEEKHSHLDFYWRSIKEDVQEDKLRN